MPLALWYLRELLWAAHRPPDTWGRTHRAPSRVSVHGPTTVNGMDLERAGVKVAANSSRGRPLFLRWSEQYVQNVS
ncbi:hypothetical protein ACI2L1_44475 [Streptomyces sp. NPDC019531]|uniref:hypothetical protein n=1 Tax=Streptomyces sp. NPDC019531 TaxID=3365062 RepID=UPI0038513548